MERLIAAAAGLETVARLEVSRAFHGDPRRLCEALSDPAWLGEILDSPPDHPDLVRVETDLALNLRSDRGPLVFRKAAFVDLGVRPAMSGGCVGVVSWRAASFAPLFPVFSGELRIAGGRLQLHGVYAPPGGQLGLLFDRTIIHGFAERTGRWFLDRVATQLEGPAPTAT